MSDAYAQRPPPPPNGMLCPVCAVGLVMSDRQGVEIDYCPKCRGVWLDRGELDKLIDMSTRQPAPMAPPPGAPPPQPYGQPPTYGRPPEPPPQPGYGYRFDDDDDYRRRQGGQRKKSWLGDLFD